MRKTTIKVLIVDDSPTVRATLTRVLSDEPDIDVVGGATDPYDAREFILRTKPDVILLDIEMPRMDGLTFLKKLQAHYPVPVIMCSGAGSAQSSAALKAIELGAVDFVAKPSEGGREALRRLCEDLADKIRAANIAAAFKPTVPNAASTAPRLFRSIGRSPDRYLVTIGASTGGTEAIKKLLSHVPADFPPVAIVQHMPADFTKSFAERLDQFSAMTVTEAVDGDELIPGRAFVARGGIQMAVRPFGQRWRLVYGSAEPVNRHCPSVDVLFDSVARHAGRRAIGVLLTGMGADGAKGLLKLREHGAMTLAQDKASCVVYGMPKVATELGAAQQNAPPEAIPELIMRGLASSRGARREAHVASHKL